MKRGGGERRKKFYKIERIFCFFVFLILNIFNLMMKSRKSMSS